MVEVMTNLYQFYYRALDLFGLFVNTLSSSSELTHDNLFPKNCP